MVTSDVSRVGIADAVFAKDDQLLTAAGLGSCVAVVLYCLDKRVAAMAHIMLPNSSIDRGSTITMPGKYADTAVPHLYQLVKERGAVHIRAKIAGGSQMFKLSQKGQMNIGPRNVDATKHELARHRIALLGEHVGGHQGRTVTFSPRTGVLKVKLFQKGTFDI
ncbi:chemotaxis protein CheD [Litoribacterium kuwaitense]|uniref:chemotaxis protein CheD n=1 Tax=Litoribacterium kuwaitense TaxID=1398745 RepID=UPI001FE71A4B|nr:chemotaxis protein CheD [Litoribacterium kuwaitense]